MSRIKTKPEETAYIGNGDEDILTARNAKVLDIIVDRKEYRLKEKPSLKIESLQELEKAIKKKTRAGKGKLRGRRYRLRKGPLFVVSGKCALLKSGNNIPGVEIVEVKALNAELLAPGTQPGRVALWTEKAVDLLEKEKLFVN